VRRQQIAEHVRLHLDSERHDINLLAEERALANSGAKNQTVMGLHVVNRESRARQVKARVLQQIGIDFLSCARFNDTAFIDSQVVDFELNAPEEKTKKIIALPSLLKSVLLQVIELAPGTGEGGMCVSMGHIY
jgi:hypothetical protein